MPRKVWNEITYPLPNFNVSTVDVSINDLIDVYLEKQHE